MSPRKRPKLTSEALDDFFAPTEKERAKPPYDQKYARHTYRVTDELHEAIKEIARREGVGLNDLVRYVLQTFIKRYQAGEIELPVQQYVVTRSRLSDPPSDS
jgi:predicted HicB family RNase H-like nuclease